MDPDLPIYYENWVEYQGNLFREAFELDNWVQLQIGGVGVSLAEWLDFDPFWREAIKQAANKAFTAQQKEAEKAKQEMKQKLESSTPYRSSFDGIPRPSFFQQ